MPLSLGLVAWHHEVHLPSLCTTSLRPLSQLPGYGSYSFPTWG